MTRRKTIAMVCGMAFIACLGARPAAARQIDLRNSLGRGLEEVIKAYTPSDYRDHVTINQLEFETSNSTLRGRATVQYGQWQEVPGISGPFGPIREPQRWKIWSARLVVHLHMPNLNPGRTDVRLDVGNIRGAVNTNSIRRRVGDWMGTQVSYLRRIPGGQPANGTMRYSIRNTTRSTIRLQFSPTGNESRLRPGQSINCNSPIRNGRFPKVKAIAPNGANWVRTIRNQAGQYRIISRSGSGIQIVP